MARGKKRVEVEEEEIDDIESSEEETKKKVNKKTSTKKASKQKKIESSDESSDEEVAVEIDQESLDNNHQRMKPKREAIDGNIPIQELTILDIFQFLQEKGKRDSNPTLIKCATESKLAMLGKRNLFTQSPRNNFNRNFNNNYNQRQNFNSPRQNFGSRQNNDRSSSVKNESVY